MKRTIILPMLSLGLLALAACANDKPAGDASSQTTTTSARAPDGLMSSNVNDTNATGAATNESPDPSMSNSGSTTNTTATGSNSTATNNMQNTPNGTGASNAQIPQTRSHSTSGHDATWGPGSTPAAGADGNAAGASQPSTSSPPPPNNAQAQNGGAAPTPMDQGNNAADLKITQQIRKQVVSDSSLSWTAKNVKIITQNGKVTLRGQVKSDDEKKWIEATADKVVGNANVDNQLQVKQ